MTGKAGFALEQVETSGKLVIEARHLGYTWGDEPLIHDFSTRIFRGDRIGLIGPNGSGKSTLLNLLLGRRLPIQVRCGCEPNWKLPILINCVNGWIRNRPCWTASRRVGKPSRSMANAAISLVIWVIFYLRRNGCVHQSSRCLAASAIGYYWRDSSVSRLSAGYGRANERP